MKKVRDGYKMTELGEIPNEWEVKNIEDIFSVRRESFNPKNEDEYDYIGLEHIEAGTGRILGIGKSTETLSNKSRFYKNDILFGKLRPYLRKYWYSKIIGVCSTEIIPLQVNNSYSSLLGFYLIQNESFIEYINSKTFGTKMPRASWDDMKEFKVAISKIKKEQEKIASILSTVDEQIDNVDGLIEKNKELKKGLMQELLTRGIGHIKFKKTEVGDIPEEWEISKLESRVEIRSGNSPSDFELCEDGKYPFFKVDDMNYTSKYLNTAKVYFNNCRYELMEKGMVVFPKRGASIFTNKVAILGKSGYFDTNTMGLKCLDTLNNEYLFYQLKFIGLDKFADTTAVPQINNKHINPLIIPIPSFEEQYRIVDILSKVDEKIEEYEKKKQKLEAFKKGLMQQLLTGKIRVY